MKRLMLCLALFSDTAAYAQESADKRLDGFFAEMFQAELASSPMYQTNLGLKDDYDKWDDMSDAAAREQLERDKRTLGRLWTEFDLADLDADSRISYRLFEERMQRSIDGFEWRFHRYPVNQMFGMHTGLVSFLLNKHRVDTLSDAQAYLTRLQTIDQPLGQLVDTLEACAEHGVIAPRFVFEHVLRDCHNVLSGAPLSEDDSENMLLADFRSKLAALELEAEVEADLLDQAEQALTTVLAPAYGELIATLEDQQKLATTEDGCWKLPNGAAFYARALRNTTTTHLTANEIHELGLSEVARIHGEMEAIKKQVKFDGSLKEFFEFLRTDPRFYYPNDEAGKAAYLAEATRLVNGMRERLSEFFVTLPKAEMIVRAVEPYRERSAGKAFYEIGTPDGSRPGVYYANLYDMTAMPIYQMEALAYHEGIPGHHMQGSIAQELQDVPAFRQHSNYTAYGEGWGLYTEHFPKEFGFYEDPYSDFGRLAMQLWRACRLVVDTGLHDKRWTREQAIQYLLTNTPNPESDAVKAIERYIVMPSQATAYQIGMLKILELRAMARKELGAAFDIAEFHDVLLTNGPVPLTLLEELVRDWVRSKKA